MLAQPSVIESPMKTTRFSDAAGDGSAALGSRYFARFGQSASVSSILARRRAAPVSSAAVGKGAAGVAAGAAAGDEVDGEFCDGGGAWARAGCAEKNVSVAAITEAAVIFERQCATGFICGLYNSAGRDWHEKTGASMP